MLTDHWTALTTHIVWCPLPDSPPTVYCTSEEEACSEARTRANAGYMTKVGQIIETHHYSRNPRAKWQPWLKQ